MEVEDYVKAILKKSRFDNDAPICGPHTTKIEIVNRINNKCVEITRLNAETLQLIAKEANGEYIYGNSTAAVVEQIRDILNAMDKKEFEAKEFAEYKDQFQWFLGIGLFFLILDVLFLERKTGWLKRLNLFNENL